MICAVLLACLVVEVRYAPVVPAAHGAGLPLAITPVVTFQAIVGHTSSMRLR